MSVATIGAFALVLFPDSDPHMAEGAAVMLFYQVGELFQSYAVGKIAQIHRRHDGHRTRLRQRRTRRAARAGRPVRGGRRRRDRRQSPASACRSTAWWCAGASAAGHRRPHRRVGAARGARAGDEIISGCVNMTGLIAVRVTKPFGAVHRKPASWSSWRTRPRRRPRPRTSSPASRATTPRPSVGIAVLLGHHAAAAVRAAAGRDWVQRGLDLPGGVVPVRARHQRAAVVLRRHRRRLARWASS